MLKNITKIFTHFFPIILLFAACEPDPPGEGRYNAEDFEGKPQVLLRLVCETAPGSDPNTNPKHFIYFYFADSKVKLGEINECRTIPYDSWEQLGIPEASIAVTGGFWKGEGSYYYAIRDDGKLKVYLKTVRDNEVPGPAREIYVAKTPEELQ
jgi:hypothetical protein